MGKLKLLLVSLLSMLAWNGALAENIETDVTAQFPLDWQGWTGATGFVGWAAPQVKTNDGRTTAACEQYNEATIAQTGVVFSRKLTGLANGNYTIELYGAAAFTPGRSCSSTLVEGDMTAVYLYAETPSGTVKQYIPAHVATDFNDSGLATATLEGITVTDGSITIGMYKDQGLTNWHVVQIKGVTAVVDKDELLASLFAPLEEALANGDAVKAKVEDEDAIATYEAAVAPYVAANANRTVDYDVTSAVAAVNAAILQLSKYQTADGSDLSGFIVNPEINDADGWTCERPVGGNGPTLNKVSFEYWAGNANPREEGAFDYYQVITGLPNGIYTVSAEMYNSLNGEEGAEWAATCGLYASSGGNEVSVLVDVDGTNLIKYTTDEIEVTDGKLRIGVKSFTTPIAARWFVADNFKLTLVHATGGQPDPEKTPYELAMEAIQSGTSYRVFTEVDGTTYYLSTAGYLVDNTKEAASFTFAAVTADGTLYPTGWNLGCRFTNPSLTNGSTGDLVQTGHINVGGNNRNDWERQVFFLNDEGLYAVRATNANSANWGANTFWAVVTGEDGLPDAGYALTESYVWQIEEYVDPRPAAFEKVQSWPLKLQKIEGLVTDASQYISNAKDPQEGSYAALLDGDYDSFFHSTWHSSNDPGEDHYLQAELTEPVQDFYIYFKKRSQNDANRPTRIDVAGSNDGESFTAATSITEGLPTGATPIDFISEKISLSEASKYIRFTVPTTNTGGKTGDHVFFTFSEFYILPADEVVESAASYLGTASYTALDEDDIPAIDQIDEQINALAEKAAAAADAEDLRELIDRTLAIIEDKDGYIDNEGVADPVSAALGSIRALDFETTQEVADQKEEVLNQARTFFAGITAQKNIDVTEYYLVNPAPTASFDGWEGDQPNAFDPVNNNAEYWNQSGYSFHQTVTLPAGDYKLSVVAVTRDGMTAIFNANDVQTNVVTMPNSGTTAGVDYLNLRSHCKTWFDAGNGLNSVKLSLEDEGEVTLGLTADSNNGDHWLVWRNFSIVLVAPAAEDAPYKAALAAIEDGANYSVFTEVGGQKYYLTADGELSADHSEAGAFTFQKVVGEEYEYGYKLADSYFTNPGLNNGEAVLNSGKINTNASARDNWEAQVFFLNDEGKYAVRATNAPGGDSSWNLVAKAFWTANEGENGPVAEYSFDQNYIWQLEENAVVEVVCNLVENGEVTATETVNLPVGFAPEAPATFGDNFHGLYGFTPDVAEVAEDTKTVNFTPAWDGPFEFSENFENAKWYNMNIRSNYWVAVDEEEPYKPTADKDLKALESQWAFFPVEGELFQVKIVNRAAGEGATLTKDESNVVMRDGDYAWEIFANSDGFVIREIGTETNWVNQNGGSAGPLQFWNNANGKTDNGSTFRVVAAEEPEVPAVVLNAPTWNAENGTQAEPYMLPVGTPLMITYTADNLEENGISEDDVKVKVTVLVSGDVDTSMQMGSETAHSVRGETFYIPLGETEFPVALKEGYYYQSIAVMAAELVKPGTEETPDEVIATYAGAPVMLRWVGVPAVSEYDMALDAIKDGHHYRIFSEVDGQKYYVTNAGTLTANAEEAPSFNFQKVVGEEYEYGFMLQSTDNSYFSNPAGTTEAALTQGHLNATTSNKRNTWEAQVFFLNADGLYAVRSTNAAYGETSWNWIGSAFWTVNMGEEGPLAEYSFDQNYIWQLEEDESYIEMALNLIYNGEKIATKSATFQIGETPAAPAEFNNGLVTLTADVETVAEDTKEVNFTAEWNGLFEFSEDYASAKWYNMNIRSSYWVAMDESEPYYPKADKDLVAPESMWAFIGNPFNLTIINRAAGEGQSLTKDGSNVVMRDGEYAWELFGNSDGFVLRAPGTANDWVNQNGGASGPLQFWVSANGKTDNGSTFRVDEAEEIGLVKIYKFEQEEVPVADWETLTAFDASVINEAAELLGAAPADLIYQLVDSTGVRTDYNGNPGEVLFWVDYEGNKSNWGVNNKYYIMYDAETPEISITQLGAEKDAVLNAVVRLANADGKYVEFRIKESMEPMVYVFLKDFAAVADPIQLTIQAAGEGLGEDASDALDLDAIKAAVGENYVVYGKGVLVDGEQTICTDYSCDPHPGFWCLQDGTASTWFDEASTFGISFFADEAVFKAWSKAAWTEAATAYFYFVNEETKQYQAVEIQLLPGQGAEGTEYAGVINQTQTHPTAGVVGETTGEQTVTITPVDDEHVNITYSGFDLPMAALGSFGEFTIENVTVTKNEDGSISYSAESFVVTSTRGQMTINYNGTLEGTQASEEATPVLKLVLQNATTDTVWFGADQAAIDAVGIRGINADEIEGTIYDLGGRKVNKIQRGGIYVINGKKVAIK
ncbi:MAG: discoidin domain-containing protein [Bacteroidaceae bacterium]|nr:discoidin domain-containing protein [Bacteroidaceae bacterium]